MDLQNEVVIAKTRLSSLARKEEEAISQFGDQLMQYGAAILKADMTEYLSCVAEADVVARQFFELSQEEKLSFEMQSGDRDFGYVSLPGVKEHFQMRMTDDPKFPWPSPEFQNVSERYYTEAMKVTRIVLRAISLFLGLPEQTLADDLLDPEERQHWSSTIYRYFHYYMLPLEESGDVPPCYIHTDIGIITVIPVSSLPALQIVNPTSYDWICVEDYAEPGDVFILAGEMLQYASAHNFGAVVHRVSRLHGTVDRFSQVFLVRGRPDAVLNPSLLPATTNINMHLGRLEREPITVADFMKEKYSTRVSANFVKAEQGTPKSNLRGAK